MHESKIERFELPVIESPTSSGTIAKRLAGSFLFMSALAGASGAGTYFLTESADAKIASAVTLDYDAEKILQCKSLIEEIPEAERATYQLNYPDINPVDECSGFRPNLFDRPHTVADLIPPSEFDAQLEEFRTVEKGVDKVTDASAILGGTAGFYGGFGLLAIGASVREARRNHKQENANNAISKGSTRDALFLHVASLLWQTPRK